MHKKSILLFLFLIGFLCACSLSSTIPATQKTTEIQGYSIPISWFSELKGDFSFSTNWEYARGVDLNDYQQIICFDCPTRASKMLDRRRKINSDSMNVFYTLIDSTRHYYSLESRCSMADMKESKFISVKKYGDFTIDGVTKSSDSLNCSLFFRIKDDLIISWIYVKSQNNETEIYPMKDGKFFVDQGAFDNGILKANFSFVYYNRKNSFKALYWSGKIHAKITNL
jgi:hypothetical protein